MQISITARHCTVPEFIRAQAEARLERLRRYEPRADNAIVEFDNDNGKKLVDARVSVAGRPALVAHGSGDDFRMALEQSMDRLCRRLKRSRERLRKRKAT